MIKPKIIPACLPFSIRCKSGEHPSAFYQEPWHAITHGEVWLGEMCNRGELERGLAAGFTDYLTKPLDVGHFNRVVDVLLKSADLDARALAKDKA